MLKLKKSVAFMLVLSSNMVFASSLVTPYEHNAWEIGLSALYLQPSFAGNGLGYSTFSNYAGADNSGVIVTSNGANHIYNVTPNWAPGFELEGAYHYCVGNDVNINWYHLNENVNGHLPQGSMFSGSADGFYAGNLQLATKWDAVNLELGKRLDFSDRKLFRLYAGLAFANIRNTFTNYPKLFPTSSTYFTSTDTISYTGVGPRVGTDFGYLAGCGFGVYLKAAGSLLVGSAKQSVSGYRDLTTPNYGLIPFGIPNYHQSSSNVVVPELEAKLGVSYDYKLACGNLGVDLGYMWMSYLNSIVSYTGIGVVGSSIGVPATTHFNLNGLTLGVKWVGDI